MTNKFILLIDMDGPLARWYDGLTRAWQAYYPDRPLLPYEKLTSFYVEDVHPEDYHADLRRITCQGSFYENLQPVEGALEALKDMQLNCQDFMEPFLCSSPEIEFDELDCHSQKARWVRTHLGEYWVNKLILTRDKTLVRGNVLIDDKPAIKGAMAPTWEHLVYESPYSGLPETHTFKWSDWPNLRDIIKIQQEQKDSRIITSPHSREEPRIITLS